MRLQRLILILTFFIPLTIFGQLNTKECNKNAINFIEVFKSKDKKSLSNIISYPINRKYPIPPISNEKEFIDRFDELFDDSLSKKIINSDTNRDWTCFSYKGIMLDNGDIWLTTEGSLTAINYQTDIENKIWGDLIEKNKKSLHISIQNFSKPILEWETNTKHIRIDEISKSNYRLCIWPINTQKNSIPEIIIENGYIYADGSGGNHHYEFKKDGKDYLCYVWIISKSEEDIGDFEIYKNNKLLLNEKVTLKK